MINRLLWITAIATIFLAYLLWDARGATRNTEEIAALEKRLVHAKCTQPEMVDRHLLQQSWFHDENFSELAGAFGQFTFSLYERGTAEPSPLEGAYCIEGKILHVRYFERSYVPVRIRPTEMAIEFGTTLKPLGEDMITVRELNNERMVLSFNSDGSERVFYRKN